MGRRLHQACSAHLQYPMACDSARTKTNTWFQSFHHAYRTLSRVSSVVPMITWMGLAQLGRNLLDPQARSLLCTTGNDLKTELFPDSASECGAIDVRACAKCSGVRSTPVPACVVAYHAGLWADGIRPQRR